MKRQLLLNNTNLLSPFQGEQRILTFHLIINSGKSNIEIIFSDGKSHLTEGLVLDKKTSAQVFGRSGSVEQIKVNIEIKSVK